MSKNRGNPFSRVLRKATKFLWAKESLEHLALLRSFELDFAARCFTDGGMLLEIGAGTGWQARALQAKGFNVDAIDLSSSNYQKARIFPVVDYDGYTIPFSDGTFDVVFSSNVLEHIPHLHAFQKEMQRVLKPGGLAVHIVPSSSWRFWTNITEVLKSWRLPQVHGEHSSNALTEIRTFNKHWWCQLFEQTGWQVLEMTAVPIFYTGRSIMGKRLAIPRRQVLSRILGGSTTLFVLNAKDAVSSGPGPEFVL